MWSSNVRMRGAEREASGGLHRKVILVLVVGLLGACVPSAANAAVSYVAMGDSYTSGPGITPYAPAAPPECGQSEHNYPHLVAAALNMSLTDVSCGGAKTENFTMAQYPDQPPQFDALSASTEVVSIGMGGNDNNLFGTLLTGCTETEFEPGPKGKAPCEAKYQSFVEATIAADKPAQEQALKEVHTLAPKAKVFVVGYPEITPQHGPCPTFPWRGRDLKWFRNVTKLGDSLIKAGAKANGASFVDTFKPSEGHNACEPVGTRWIEPLIESLTGVPVHPNALGEENDAFDVELAMLKAGVR
jgi:GDSL-like lipase/acylhydrolase family protein